MEANLEVYETQIEELVGEGCRLCEFFCLKINPKCSLSDVVLDLRSFFMVFPWTNHPLFGGRRLPSVGLSFWSLQRMASQAFVATNVLLGWKSGQTHQEVQEFPLSSFHLFSFSLIFMTFWKGENHKWCLGFLLRMVGGTMLQSCLKWMQQHRLCVKMLPGQLSWGKPPRNVYWSLNPSQCNQVSCFPIERKFLSLHQEFTNVHWARWHSSLVPLHFTFTTKFVGSIVAFHSAVSVEASVFWPLRRLSCMASRYEACWDLGTCGIWSLVFGNATWKLCISKTCLALVFVLHAVFILSFVLFLLRFLLL